MRNTSTEYQSAMAENIKPRGVFEASINLTEEQTEELTSNFIIPSNITPADCSSDPTKLETLSNYITFDKDFYKIGSNNLTVCPDYEEQYQNNGFVDGSVATNTTQDKYFEFCHRSMLDKSFELYGLSFLIYEDSMPLWMELRLYIDNEIVYRKALYHTLLIDDSNYYAHGYYKIKFIGLPPFNRAVLVCSMEQNKRVRIKCISVLPVEINFDMHNLISLDYTESIDAISSALPSKAFNLTIDNLENTYTTEDPTNLINHLKNGIEMNYKIGAELANTTEWVRQGKIYLKDVPVCDANSVKFQFVDKLSLTTIKSVDGEEAIDIASSMYVAFNYQYLAKDLLEYAGIFDYSINNSLQTKYYKGCIPELPIRELLQLIANACCCVLYEDDSGRVHIEPFDTSIDVADAVYSLGYDKSLAIPVVKKAETPKSINVSYYSMVMPNQNKEQILTVEFENSVDSDIDLILNHDSAYATAVHSTDGSDIYSHILSVKHISLTKTCVRISRFAPFSKFELWGRKVETVKSTVTVKNNKGTSSEVCSIDNPLIVSKEQAIEVANWAIKWLNYRDSYELNYMQDYSLELLDTVRMQTRLSDERPSVVTKLKMSLPNATGAITLKGG